MRGVDDKFDGAILDELRWQDNLLQSAICLRGMKYKRGRGNAKKVCRKPKDQFAAHLLIYLKCNLIALI